MSNRVYVIIGVIGDEPTRVVIQPHEIFNNFKGTELYDTELHYTIVDEVDTILDLKVNETIHFYEDRAKEFPCILKRIQ